MPGLSRPLPSPGQARREEPLRHCGPDAYWEGDFRDPLRSPELPTLRQPMEPSREIVPEFFTFAATKAQFVNMFHPLSSTRPGDTSRETTLTQSTSDRRWWRRRGAATSLKSPSASTPQPVRLTWTSSGVTYDGDQAVPFSRARPWEGLAFF
jgi:hypothetical protein